MIKPCPYCNQSPGEITDESPKCISFENKNYRLDVDRTWEGMEWGEPSAYTLHHWCSWSNGFHIKVRGKTMVEMKQNWKNYE